MSRTKDIRVKSRDSLGLRTRKIKSYGVLRGEGLETPGSEQGGPGSG